MNNQKQYILDDRTVITPGELALKLHCSTPSARTRLEASSNPAVLFRPLGQGRTIKPYKTKKYLMTNGKSYNAHQLSKLCTVELHTIRCRLSNGWRDFDKVTMPVQVQKQTKLRMLRRGSRKLGVSAQRIYDTKPINDPMSILWMRLGN